MKNPIAILLISLALTASAQVRQVLPPINRAPAPIDAPTMAERIEQRARHTAMIERRQALNELANISASTNAATSAEINAQVATIRDKTTAMQAFSAVVDDTRANIPETATLSDIQIAGLYLNQVKKSADELAETAPTNTIEYLIGAGMRKDLNKENENE